MKTINLLFAIFIILGFYSCNSTIESKKDVNTSVTIAITKAHGSNGYLQYKKWLLSIDSNLILVDLYGLNIDSAIHVMKTVDALLVSGGPDVNPSRYSYDSMSVVCEVPDNYRDSLELKCIDYAYNSKMPILGICRGQQIINVYFGGSLITDIPSQHPSNIIHRANDRKVYHKISIIPNTFLSSLYSYDTLEVNSAHHQAVEHIGRDMEIFAYSPDSIIESIGFKKDYYSNFFLAVQFHPEYMEGTMMSESIGNKFVEAAKSNNLKRK